MIIPYKNINMQGKHAKIAYISKILYATFAYLFLYKLYVVLVIKQKVLFYDKPVIPDLYQRLAIVKINKKVRCGN